jgi:hypothetical protein
LVRIYMASAFMGGKFVALELKSIHELRAIAQALGVKFKWEDDKPTLLKAIDIAARREVKPPEPVPPI